MFSGLQPSSSSHQHYHSSAASLCSFCLSSPTMNETQAAIIVDDFDKINLNRELKHEITYSQKDFTK
jgi:predicted NUDIX family phosphoesterase